MQKNTEYRIVAGEICYTWCMKHKSTVYGQEFHNQYEGSEEDIRQQKRMLKEKFEKDKREGQSDFRKDKATKRGR